MGDNEALKLLGIYALHWPSIVMIPIVNDVESLPLSKFCFSSAIGTAF